MSAIIVRPRAWVTVTPPGSKPAMQALRQPGAVVGLFDHEVGVQWPNRAGCASASALLADGSPIILEFSAFADALAARDRLVREARR